MVAVTAMWVWAGTVCSICARRILLSSAGELHPPLLLDGGDNQRRLAEGWPYPFSRPWLLVFHPYVLSQPLFRSCHIFTLVTHVFSSSSRITGSPRWRPSLLRKLVLLCPLGISPEGWGACLLLGNLTGNVLAPGVQGEGEGGTNGNGEVEGMALPGQRLAEVQALGEQGWVNFHTSHFGLLLN